MSNDGGFQRSTARRGEADGELVRLERWDGPWSDDDLNRAFKADIALYAHSDPMTTIRGLAEAVGLPAGVLAHYVLARYATSGSAGLLELGPAMVHRLWEPIDRAESVGDDRTRLDAYEELRSVISWLRSPLVDPALAASAYPSGGSLPPVED